MSNPIPIPKRSPWVTQVLVIRALFKLEVASRFGEYRLGFLWMLLEPILGTIIIGVVLRPLMGKAVPEMPYAFFLLNGYMHIRIFTGTMNTGINSITSNQGLLVYPTVRPMDPLLARFIFNLITTIFSFVLFCVVGMWIGITLSLYSLHIILAAYLMTWLCGCGFGLLFGIAAAYYNEIEKVVPIIQRPLLFISAVMFPSSIVTGPMREIFLYNPLVHTIELSRNALFPHYHIEDINLFYPFAFSIIVLAIGITYFHNNRNHLSQL